MKNKDLKPKCKTRGCRKRVKDTYPLPYEYMEGKYIKLFGWVIQVYRDKKYYTDYCDLCLLEQEQNKYRDDF